MRREQRLVAAIAALLAASPAIAQEPCAPIRALTNADGQALADLRLGFVGNDGLGLFAGASASALLPASDCELSAAYGDQQLNCQWRFDTLAEAEAFFNTASATLRGCTGLVPEILAVDAGEQGWQVRRRQRLERNGNGVATQVTQDRVEYRPGADQLEHRVVLESVIAPY